MWVLSVRRWRPVVFVERFSPLSFCTTSDCCTGGICANKGHPMNSCPWEDQLNMKSTNWTRFRSKPISGHRTIPGGISINIGLGRCPHFHRRCFSMLERPHATVIWPPLMTSVLAIPVDSVDKCIVSCEEVESMRYTLDLKVVHLANLTDYRIIIVDEPKSPTLKRQSTKEFFTTLSRYCKTTSLFDLHLARHYLSHFLLSNLHQDSF